MRLHLNFLKLIIKFTASFETAFIHLQFAYFSIDYHKKYIIFDILNFIHEEKSC